VKFISLVYPSAFRGVLVKLIESGDTDVEEDHWIAQWLKFINVGLGIKIIPSTETENNVLTTEQEEWIDECVNEFSKKMKLFEKFIAL